MPKKSFFVDIDLNKQELLQARLENRSSSPSGLVEGDAGYIYWNTTEHAPYIWDGTQWVNLLNSKNIIYTGSVLESVNVEDALEELNTKISDAGGGTVTSVGVSTPTGLQISGSPITTSGVFTITWEEAYQAYTTAESEKLANLKIIEIESDNLKVDSGDSGDTKTFTLNTKWVSDNWT